MRGKPPRPSVDIQPALFDDLKIPKPSISPTREGSLTHPDLSSFTSPVSRIIAKESSDISADNQEKIDIFKRLFRGRMDAFAYRWEQKTGEGKSGYNPACDNEWHPLLCNRPEIPCKDCRHRQNIAMSDYHIRSHLKGNLTMGMYAIMSDDTCYFLAVDFDKENWRSDAAEFMKSCRELGVPAALEISRSGNGAHVWIFFADRILAKIARRLGAALITHVCDRTGSLKLTSFDRLFPNQDSMPAGGYGNLISLPLQPGPRRNGWSCFVNEDFEPIPDQWAYMATLPMMAIDDPEKITYQIVGDADPLDLAFSRSEDLTKGVIRSARPAVILSCTMPKSLTIRLEDKIYIPRSRIPIQLQIMLTKLTWFKNLKFFLAQNQGLSTWNIPRIVSCDDNTLTELAYPRGCLDGVLEILKAQKIKVKIKDERFGGHLIDVSFNGDLHDHQVPAFDTMMQHDIGVLHGGTAFGKTVVSAKLIAERSTNTLVLVDTAILLEQWIVTLQNYLGEENVGWVAGGEDKLTGTVDVALMASLSVKGKRKDVIRNYGQVIVDECHRVGADTYEALLKRATGRYVIGLSANDKRRDGHEPKVFMQCGPIRYSGSKPASVNHEVLVKLHRLDTHLPETLKKPHELVSAIVSDPVRNQSIIKEIVRAYKLGRKILVLTDRIEHRDALASALAPLENVFVMRQKPTNKKDRAERLEDLMAMNALAFDVPRVVIGTGKICGTGFNHSPLDTLMPVTPINYIGDVEQYKGRVDRNLESPIDPWIYDFFDVNHAKTVSYFNLRKRAYRKLGYRLQDPEARTADIFDSND